MKISSILHATCVNGPGIRTAIFFSGCARDCKGCHNKELQDFNAGIEINVSEIIDEIEIDITNQLIDGVTLTGGDPIYQKDGVVELCSKLKGMYPNLSICLYTGEYFDNISDDIKEKVDIIVDGPFVEELKSTDKKYMGSSNQHMYTKKIEGGNLKWQLIY